MNSGNYRGCEIASINDAIEKSIVEFETFYGHKPEKVIVSSGLDYVVVYDVNPTLHGLLFGKVLVEYTNTGIIICDVDVLEKSKEDLP
jgi:hypothetical protein